ncbi:type II secretion system protein GspG [Pyxidicoccus sp. 3LG]
MNLHTRVLRCRQSRGQTVIELWILLVIFGLIGTAVALAVIPELDKARRQQVEMDLELLETALERFASKHDHYPDETRGLRALLEAGNVSSLGSDPWRHDYVYRLRNGAPVILSYGEDGVPGGEGIDADISRQLEPLPVSEPPPVREGSL